ncbi:MAG: 2-C-methyl-D-erythritol 4-phosphate cytidylyltransferase [Crocinitomicaceae bacterium]|nr:2-C-methyl-D-erythritol 4-phosphate cytidylyltransferase [Crocinitomicaceae bacterium]
MKYAVIISAGGKGKRMQSDLPKQFMLVNGKPIILHTIQKFISFDPHIEIVIVLPEDFVPVWEEICEKYFFTAAHKVAIGGEERFHSIQNGLKEVTAELVAVHDAVRPFVSVDLIKRCFDHLQNSDAVVPVYDINESVRKVDGIISVAVDRNKYKLVQTPQCFKKTVLDKAYHQPYSPMFTDDASVVEATGIKVTCCEGIRENIKITAPFDLKLAELFFKP